MAMMGYDQQHFYPSTANMDISPSLWPKRTDSFGHSSLSSSLNEGMPNSLEFSCNESPAYSNRPVHDSARSICSVASGKSKLHFPTFDAASIKSMPHHYRRRIYSTDAPPASPEQPPSPNSLSSSGKFHNRYSVRGSVSTTNLSLVSTSTLELANAMGNNPEEQRNTKLPETSHKRHHRSRSMKRLVETSESVSRASNKAFAGLGQMLKKAKSQDVAPGPLPTDK
jgi:hypothetical protein